MEERKEGKARKRECGAPRRSSTRVQSISHACSRETSFGPLNFDPYSNVNNFVRLWYTALVLVPNILRKESFLTRDEQERR